MSLPRLAVICDFREENWPSMDLVADQLLEQLQRDYSHVVVASRICPPMRRRLTRQESDAGASGIPNQTTERSARFNADRVLNRFWDYPRFVKRLRNDFDLFHVIDHSYAQLLHELPADRTVVTCHDLDTFQCLLEPAQDPRSIFFRKMMGRTLSGFRQAARVTCDSVATREQVLAYRLVPPERTVVVANGVHPCFSPEPSPTADAAASELIGAKTAHQIDILHVGSTIPRKRIDLLLQIFARLKARKDLSRNLRLLRVGGAFSAEQLALAEKFALRESIVVLPRVSSEVLAALYRRAALVLQPSEREGFGLPVVEAMACGSLVIASDIPVLREVGGDAAGYCPVANISSWTEAVIELLAERRDHPDRLRKRKQQGLKRAATLSWAAYTEKMVALYKELV